jgi:hypothetical protein
MANRGHAPRQRWSGRILVRLGGLLAVGALFTVVLAQLWSATTRDLTVVDSERAGAAYLRPLTHLIGQLADAQSAAVRAEVDGGSRVDAGKVNAAVAAVDQADRAGGGPLGVHQRWADLRSRITALLGGDVRGQAAYDTYADLSTLAVELARKVGDSSQLILDPELDSYYLMDTSLLRIPDVLVFSGRAADLALLAQQKPSDVARSRAAVARYQVATASDAIGAGLTKAMDSTRSVSLGPNVTGQLDAFRTAVDAYVPPAALLQNMDSPAPDALSANATRVRQQALPLADAAITELDSLLRSRHDGLATQRAWAVTCAVVGVLLAVVLMWLLLPAAPVATAGSEPDSDENREAAEAGPPEGVDTTFVDPHDLIAVEELLHVGRAVRARKRERVDDAR